MSLIWILVAACAKAPSPGNHRHPGINGGGADTGGGEFKDATASTAWFLGRRAIRYCLVASDAFEVPVSTLERETARALDDWKKYIDEKKVNERDFVLFSQTAIATEHERMPTCDGSEDLKLYFGVSNAETEEVRKHYTNPVSFAHRESYDAKAGWGKGLIWFALPGSVGPFASHLDWNKPGALHLILLHELGHMLGNPHIDGTIMAEDIANQVFLSKEWKPETIDWQLELVPCEGNCSHVYVGRMGHFDMETGKVIPGQAFQRLMGREPSGIVQAKVQRYPDERYVLHVQDEQGKRSFPIVTQPPWSFYCGYARPFSVYKEFDGGLTFTGAPTGGQHGFGKVLTSVGSALFLSIDRNSKSFGSPFSIQYQAGDSWEALFETLWPGQRE
jgi:hypothetical protein